MSFSHNDINKKAVYILSIDGEGNFQSDYLPIQIDKNLSESFQKLNLNFQENLANKNLTKLEIYNLNIQLSLEYWENIKKNHPYLLGYRNYCTYISSSYVSPPGISENFEMKFLPFSPDYSDYLRIKINNENWTLLDSIFSAGFFDSYFIEQAYSECNKTSNIKAYSHRRIGWTTYHFELNNIFSIELKTNFGYGYANYFCVVLIFDGIQIIPYSRLIRYFKADFIQLIRNTWDFYITDDSWGLAFDKIRDACNSYNQEGKDSFVKQYFFDELEKFTKKLKDYLYESKFELSENQEGNWIGRNEEKNKTIELNGFELIVFRGEKVSGAVGFVESIKKINKFFPTQNYIEIIIECCQTVLPQLQNSIEDLVPIIGNLENMHQQECENLKKIKIELEKIKPIWENFKHIEKSMLEKLYEENKHKPDVTSIYSKKITELVSQQMIYDYPEMEKILIEYTNFNKEIEDSISLCAHYSSKIYTHKSYLSQISGFKENIESFLAI